MTKSDLVYLMKVQRGINRVQKAGQELMGAHTGGDTGSALEDLMNLTEFLTDYFRIAEDNETQNRFFTMLESDLPPEKKADKILNWS